MKLLQQERGISLIEVIASIVLITVIFLSFFTLFLQTKKINVQSESIQNATYVAQVEMEEIYTISQTRRFSDIVTTSNENQCDSYTKSSPSDFESSSILNKFKEPYEIIVTLSPLCDYENAVHVLIKVVDLTNKGNEKATIENVYIWSR